MLKTILTISPILCGLFIMPSILHAGDVMTPPAVVTQGASHPTDAIADNDPSPDLHDALNAPANGSTMDIRSYIRKDGTRVTEYGQKGKVYRIKVQPPGGLPAYYLYRNTAGQFERRLPSGAKPIVAPSWILKEF